MFIINSSVKFAAILSLTIYKNSTDFMSLFALVRPPKKCEQKCEYSHYSLALAPDVSIIVCTPSLCANGNPSSNLKHYTHYKFFCVYVIMTTVMIIILDIISAIHSKCLFRVRWSCLGIVLPDVLLSSHQGQVL